MAVDPLDDDFEFEPDSLDIAENLRVLLARRKEYWRDKICAGTHDLSKYNTMCGRHMEAVRLERDLKAMIKKLRHREVVEV